MQRRKTSAKTRRMKNASRCAVFGPTLGSLLNVTFGNAAELLNYQLQRGIETAWKFAYSVPSMVARLAAYLAAGLDARPYRMALPPSLRWVEVDLPALLAYKEEILRGEKPSCALERIPLDLTDVEARRALVIPAEELRILLLQQLVGCKEILYLLEPVRRQIVETANFIKARLPDGHGQDLLVGALVGLHVPHAARTNVEVAAGEGWLVHDHQHIQWVTVF